MLEINKLKERIEELEFENMWQRNKLNELEEKRKYYREDREKKFKKLLDVRYNPLDEDETTKRDIRIKEMTIHEKFDWIVEDYMLLSKTKRHIMDEWYGFYTDNVSVLVDIDTINIPLKILEDTYNYITEGGYADELRDDIIETIEDDIPDSIYSEVVRRAVENGDCYTEEAYDEEYDKREELETERNDAYEFVKDKVKLDRFKSLKWGLDDNYLKDMFAVLFNSLDSITKERDHFKAGYETLKESSGEDVAIEMMEKIMDKTKAITENDMERVDEINRLKRKCNDLLFKLRVILKQYINRGRTQNSLCNSVFVNPNFIRNAMENMFDCKVKLTNASMSNINSHIQWKLDNLMRNECSFRDDLLNEIKLFYGRMFNDCETSASYITMIKNEVKENPPHYEEKFNEENKYWDIHYIKYNEDWIEKQNEEIKDINNY